MAEFSFNIDGIEDFSDRLDVLDKLIDNIGTAMYQFAEEVMTDSKAVVPVDTGALMNTGKVMQPEADDTGVSVTFGYGDESVDYAMYVHEELSAWKTGNPINWTRPGSGPKYLENPLKAKQDELPGRIMDATKSAFKV